MTEYKKHSTVEPIVIFIASSTPEKVRDLQLIAEAKNIPIIFEDYNKLMGAFPHADEVSGDFKLNAKGKLESIDISHFKNGEKHRIENYFKDRGLPNTLKMYVATEDGGFSLPKEVWGKVDRDGIPESVRSKIKQTSNSAYSGPGSETAPVMSAVLGEYNLMGRIQKAIASLGIKESDVSVLQNAEIRLKPVWNVDNTEILSFGAEKTTYLHATNNEIMADIYKNNKGRISNYRYIQPSQEGDKSIIDLGPDGITQHSVRSELVDKLYNHFFAEEIKHGYQPNYTHPYKDIINEGHVYRIGAFGTADAQLITEKMQHLHNSPKLGKGYALSVATIPHKSDRYRDPKTMLESSYDILSQIERTMANSDSIILFPDSVGPKKKAETTEEKEQEKLSKLIKIFMLENLVVNMQLNARDSRKPVIIMNHDGSWDEALAIHNNSVNIGMTKDYSISLPAKLSDSGKSDAMNIKSNSYFHVLGTPENGKSHSYEATENAAIELLHSNRKGYNPRMPSKSQKIETGNAPHKFSGYKVAVFCSAGNENKYLNESVKNLSYNLVKKDFGIIYGGGDRYTMGAVLDGVLKRREELTRSNGHKGLTPEEAIKKTYIAGYSTKQILKAETEKSAFSPKLNYAKQNENIYQRMADMLENSDAVVAAPGGAGTIQEWAAALILNHSRPKDQQKPVVFYNPELNTEKVQVWNVALKTILGEKDYKLLTDENASPILRAQRSRELGIYVETSEAKVQTRLVALREEHELRHAKKKYSHVDAYVSRQSSLASGIGLV